MIRGTHSFTQGDLFHVYDLKKFKFKEGSGDKKKMKALYKYGCKNDLIAKIFLTLMKMITEDMVENGSTFHLPTKTIAMFTWEKLQGDKFSKAYQSGKFNQVDFIQTGFTIYLPVFKYFFRERFREKDIILNDEMKKMTTKLSNEGFKYC